jgi:hypothetical protein
MGRAIACAMALIGASAIAAPVAQGKLLVTVQVVDHAKVEMAMVPEAAQARWLKQSGVTEWSVPMRASVTQTQGIQGRASVELRGCDGTARWHETKDAIALDQNERSPRIDAVVKNEPSCTPIVMVTVLPDGAPPAG